MLLLADQAATYKGRPLLSAPRTDPYVRLSRIRLPPWMFDGKPLGRPRMKNFGFGQPVIGEFPSPPPCSLVSLAASFERAPPEFNHLASERRERRQVCRHGVIGEETPDHLLKPLSLLGYGIVSSPAQLRLDLAEFCPAAVTPGLPFELENAPAGFAADQCKAQEIEGLRLTETALFAVVHRVAAELDQPGLLRVERQRELRKPSPHHLEKPMRIGLALEPDHQIIRIARDDHGAGGFPPPAVGPKIEDIVQVNVGEQR